MAFGSRNKQSRQESTDLGFCSFCRRFHFGLALVFLVWLAQSHFWPGLKAPDS